MHSQRAMNPRDELAQQLMAVQARRGKTLEDREQLSDLEFQLNLYFDDRGGPIVPYLNLKRCLEDGGKQLKLGTHLRQSLHPLPGLLEFPLLYTGPRDMAGLMAEARFRDVRTVDISGRVVERTRPIFTDWKLEARYRLDTERLDLARFRDCAVRAGHYIGLGDFRPEFGLFEVDVTEVG